MQKPTFYALYRNQAKLVYAGKSRSRRYPGQKGVGGCRVPPPNSCLAGTSECNLILEKASLQSN